MKREAVDDVTGDAKRTRCDTPPPRLSTFTGDTAIMGEKKTVKCSTPQSKTIKEMRLVGSLPPTPSAASTSKATAASASPASVEEPARATQIKQGKTRSGAAQKSSDVVSMEDSTEATPVKTRTRASANQKTGEVESSTSIEEPIEATPSKTRTRSGVAQKTADEGAEYGTVTIEKGRIVGEITMGRK